LLAVGCGTDDGPAQPALIAGFAPPALPAGYTRFITPEVDAIQPGADLEYCQWVAGPAKTAQDVMDFKGVQSLGGHHAVLYATTETQFAVGESHICTVDDMVPVSFIGAIGGEGNGGSASKLPDGLFFRVPEGEALMVNTHWLNATDDVLDGQAALDVEFGDADPSHVTADIFVNNGDDFTIPAGSDFSYDNSCTLQSDFNIVMAADHMHGAGTSAYSELLPAGGGSAVALVTDTSWTADEMFNPVYHRYSLDAPFVAHAGDTIHTHCEWSNKTSAAMMFPDEMCDGVSFYFPSHGQIACSDGQWPAP
jgi:hypothetical protein